MVHVWNCNLYDNLDLVADERSCNQQCISGKRNDTQIFNFYLLFLVLIFTKSSEKTSCDSQLKGMFTFYKVLHSLYFRNTVSSLTKLTQKILLMYICLVSAITGLQGKIIFKIIAMKVQQRFSWLPKFS